MARKWAAGLASHRIRVNIVEPGWIDTPGERTFYSEEQIREEGRKLPVNAANSIRMFGGWILQIQTWPIFGNEASQIREHAGVAERTRMRIALNLNRVSLQSPLPSGLRKREEAECSRTSVATFTTLCGAPLKDQATRPR
jgi:hypothetical protein